MVKYVAIHVNVNKQAVHVSKNSTKIISSCMFIAFVDLPSLSVQFRVVFGTRIFERLEEDPMHACTSKNKDEQIKATTIVTSNLKSDK